MKLIKDGATRCLRSNLKYFFADDDEITCNCTAHDITTPAAAHAVDCPMYDD